MNWLKQTRKPQKWWIPPTNNNNDFTVCKPIDVLAVNWQYLTLFTCKLLNKIKSIQVSDRIYSKPVCIVVFDLQCSTTNQVGMSLYHQIDIDQLLTRKWLMSTNVLLDTKTCFFLFSNCSFSGIIMPV